MVLASAGFGALGVNAYAGANAVRQAPFKYAGRSKTVNSQKSWNPQRSNDLAGCLSDTLTRKKCLATKIGSAIAYSLAVLFSCSCAGEFPTDAGKLQAAEQAYDRGLLVRSLNEIEAWNSENDTGIASALGAGRNVSSIVAEFATSECRPTEELQALWSWHDGGGPQPFVWYHDFLPVQQALSEYRSLGLNPLVQWDPRYIPIFSFEGEWFAAYCGEGASNAGPIVHYFLEDEPRITYVNLTVFMASMAEALRTDVVRWENDAMQYDIGKMKTIHQKFNPGYPFPYYVMPDGA